MAAGAILGAEPRPGGLLVDAPAGISRLSWEIKPSHTFVRVQSNLPRPCSSRARIAALAVGHIPDFPCRVSDPSHAGLECALCCTVLGVLVCSGLWLLISGSPGKPGRLQGTVAKPQGGRGVRPCVCYRVTCPWCYQGVSVLCCGSGSAQCHCAVPVWWQYLGVNALSQSAEGG